jgi:membrane fusion protein, adhesin transport system
MANVTLTPRTGETKETAPREDSARHSGGDPARPTTDPAGHGSDGHGATEHGEHELRSLRMVPHRPGWQRVALTIFLFITGIILLLIFVPWQQTVEGWGTVGVYDAMARPQNIEAQIPGRLVSWAVQEGQPVKKGQVIARIDDLEQRFLDPEQPKILRERLAAQQRRKAEEQERVARLRSQVQQLQTGRLSAIESAGERIKQATERRNIAEKSLAQARVVYQGEQEVARTNANVAREQAKERAAQAEQAVKAAQEARDAEEYRFIRIRNLYEKELRSGIDFRMAERDLVQRDTALAQAKQALEIARKEVRRTELQVDQANLNIKRLYQAVLERLDGVNAAKREIAQLEAERDRVTADTQASVNSAESNLRSALASVNQIDDTLNDLNAQIRNLDRRFEQRDVVAPRDGFVVRLGKVGAGETVKSGDILATLAPLTDDQAVEMTLSGFDAPLVAVGRRVRIQFNGFPALQVTGFPQVMVGTFAGRVANMDATDDGTGRVRVWVKPDVDAIKNDGDQPWPPSSRLRPGTDALCWVLLDTVPLGYELWRQFNGFPPSVRQPVPPVDGKGDKGGKDEKDEKGGKPKSGDIKRPKL